MKVCANHQLTQGMTIKEVGHHHPFPCIPAVSTSGLCQRSVPAVCTNGLCQRWSVPAVVCTSGVYQRSAPAVCAERSVPAVVYTNGGLSQRCAPRSARREVLTERCAMLGTNIPDTSARIVCTESLDPKWTMFLLSERTAHGASHYTLIGSR